MHVVGAARAVSLAMLIVSVIWIGLGFLDALDLWSSLTYGVVSAILFGLAFYGSHASKRGFLIPIMAGIVLFCVLLIILFILKIVGVQEAGHYGFGYRRSNYWNRGYNNRGGGWQNSQYGGGGFYGGGGYHGGGGYNNDRYDSYGGYYNDRTTFDNFLDFSSIAIGIFLLIWFMHIYVRAYRYLGLYLRASQRPTSMNQQSQQREVATNTGILRQKYVADV